MNLVRLVFALLVGCGPGSVKLGPGDDADTSGADTSGPDTDADTAADTAGSDTSTIPDTGSPDTAPVDADRDGAPLAVDCDDADPLVHPGAAEVCNGADDDCDTLVDGQDPGVEGATTWYRDADEDGRGDAAQPFVACTQPRGYVPSADDCDDADATDACAGGDTGGDTGATSVACGAGAWCLDLADDVNRDHTNGPWTDNPSESFDVAPGTHAWTVADGSSIEFVIVDPDTNGGASLLLTHGGESWRPSYTFPTSFTIDGEGASGTRMHVAGLASGWSDPTYFTGVAATMTLAFTDGTEQVVELANGTNLDDWNHTWHSVSDAAAVRVYEDTTYGRHIDAVTVELTSTAPIDTITVLDDATVHTGTAEKTSVAIFAITIE